jgi:hypothetical protein
MQVGAEPQTLILLRCENGDILVMLTPKRKRRRARRSRQNGPGAPCWSPGCHATKDCARSIRV